MTRSSIDSGNNRLSMAQCVKQYSPMRFTVEGISNFVALTLQKAQPSMSVTVAGMMILSVLESENADTPMVVTG